MLQLLRRGGASPHESVAVQVLLVVQVAVTPLLIPSVFDRTPEEQAEIRETRDHGDREQDEKCACHTLDCSRQRAFEALLAVDPDMRGDRVLQAIHGWECDRREDESGYDCPGRQRNAQPSTWCHVSQKRGEAPGMRENVDSGSPEPEDEAGLVQGDESSLGLAERQDRRAGAEQHRRREDEDRRYERTEK